VLVDVFKSVDGTLQGTRLYQLLCSSDVLCDEQSSDKIFSCPLKLVYRYFQILFNSLFTVLIIQCCEA
jgi:hypothetical protein